MQVVTLSDRDIRTIYIILAMEASSFSGQTLHMLSQLYNIFR